MFVRGVHFRPKCKTTDTVTHLCKCDNYTKCNMWLPNQLGMNLYWNGKPFGVVAADLQIGGIHGFTVSDPSGVPWRVRYLQAHEVYIFPPRPFPTTRECVRQGARCQAGDKSTKH